MSRYLKAKYNRLRPEVGREHSQHLGVISERDLQRFAVASHAPEGWDHDRGPEGGRPAPPLFLSSVMGWGAGEPEGRLGSDGTSPEETRGLPLDGVRLMGAGQDLEFHAPVRAGTSVFVHTSLDNVRIKHGSSGTLLIMQVLRRFTDDEGQPLVTCRESFIAR